MKNSFDYKKAKQDAERMLEVIERDPQAEILDWTSSITRLGKTMMALAIGREIAKTLKENENENINKGVSSFRIVGKAFLINRTF